VNRDRGITSGLLAIFTLFLLVQCTNTPPVQEKMAPLKAINSMTVLPFEPMAGLTREQTAVIGSALEPLNNSLAQYMADIPKVRVLTEPELESFATEFFGDPLARAQALGKKTGNDVVLAPFVRRFLEREGNEYSASRPASVNLEFKLVASDTGEILWSGEYDETQEPLMRNLLKFSQSAQRGFKWVTAEELAREGMTSKLDECPYITLLRAPKNQ